jgi:hypothetical protein
VLLSIAEAVAGIVAEKLLLLCRDAKFRTDSDKMCQAVRNGFAVALCVVEPDSADEFLKKSSAMFERFLKNRLAREPAAGRSTEKVSDADIAQFTNRIVPKFVADVKDWCQRRQLRRVCNTLDRGKG